MYMGGLCFITDNRSCRVPFTDMTRKVLEAGVRWVQYRDKTSSRRTVYEEALKLRAITREADAVLVVNDYSDIALAVDADGVHLGQDDLPLKKARKILGKGKIIGISTHSIEQAEEAEEAGADYIAFGPIFQTATKDAGSPKGTEMLRTIKDRVSVPVVAIGGIDLHNLGAVLETGADAVAVASAIAQGDIGQNAARFMDIVKLINGAD